MSRAALRASERERRVPGVACVFVMTRVSRSRASRHLVEGREACVTLSDSGVRV
jgi:hypothetical protein